MMGLQLLSVVKMLAEYYLTSLFISLYSSHVVLSEDFLKQPVEAVHTREHIDQKFKVGLRMGFCNLYAMLITFAVCSLQDRKNKEESHLSVSSIDLHNDGGLPASQAMLEDFTRLRREHGMPIIYKLLIYFTAMLKVALWAEE